MLLLTEKPPRFSGRKLDLVRLRFSEDALWVTWLILDAQR